MEIIWKNRFLEVAEKAIIELNLEYSSWSIGQTAKSEINKGYSDPLTRGIELADERTVCAKILIKALQSPLFTGEVTIEENGKKEPRYYKINREEKYIFDGNKKVDIFIQRYDIKDTETTDKDYEPVIIEAKRAKTYSISDLSTGDIKKDSTTYNASSTKTDIVEKLIKENNCYKYVMIWGIYNKKDENDKDNLPKKFITDLDCDIHIKDKNVKWIPLGFEKNNNLEDQPDIDKWIWLLMLEIK